MAGALIVSHFQLLCSFIRLPVQGAADVVCLVSVRFDYVVRLVGVRIFLLHATHLLGQNFGLLHVLFEVLFEYRAGRDRVLFNRVR